ncbi:MAG: ABC transporter permease, partial [Acidobacteriota bacterium]
LFAAEEYSLGSEKTMILTHRLWSSFFNSDPDIVGTTVRTADESFTVVGVMAPSFRGTVDEDEIEFWIPLKHHLGAENLENRDSRSLWVIARRGGDKGQAVVAAEMAALGRSFAESYPDANEGLSLTVQQVGAEWREDFRSNGLLLAAAVAMLLLVAASNVAGLMLARTLGRQRQFALQSAIGASRYRIFRALMIETFLLVSAGGLLGMAIAPWVLRTLLATSPVELPDYLTIQTDLRASLLAFAVVALTAVISGLLPAIIGARTPMRAVLNQGGTKSTATGSEKFIGVGLVVAEVALTMILLVCSSMLLRSHQARNNVELGYRSDIARFAITLTDQDVGDDANLPAFFERVERELGSYPGVESVGLAWPVLPPRDWSKWSIRWNGMPADLEDRGLRVGGHAFNTGLFETLEIPLIAGRFFDGNDLPDPENRVAIASRTLAMTLGGVEQALGKELQVGRGSYRVVGVVEDVLYGGAPEAGREPHDLYLAHSQMERRLLSIAVRSGGGDPAANMSELRGRLQKLAPSSPIHWVSTMDEELQTIYADSRFYVMLVGAFAASALLLTGVGLFALLSNFVTRRTRE